VKEEGSSMSEDDDDDRNGLCLSHNHKRLSHGPNDCELSLTQKICAEEKLCSSVEFARGRESVDT
jgi:hypothetical protein